MINRIMEIHLLGNYKKNNNIDLSNLKFMKSIIVDINVVNVHGAAEKARARAKEPEPELG